MITHQKELVNAFLQKLKKFYIKYGRIILYKRVKRRGKYERQTNIYRFNGISGILVYCYTSLVDEQA